MFDKSLHTQHGVLAIDLNIHTFASQPKQLNIITIFMILCLLTNFTQSNLVYKDLFDQNQNTWYACQNNGNCQDTFPIIYCGASKAIHISQSSYQAVTSLLIDIRFQIVAVIIQSKLQHTLYRFYFHRVDNSFLFEFIVYIDNKIEHQQNYSNSNSSAASCLSNYQYLIFPISITIQHSISSVTVAMQAENHYWGITEFQLQINECSLGCDSCNQFGCFNQELFLQLFQLKVFSSITPDEGWQNGSESVKQCLGFNYIVSSGRELFNVFELDLHYAISFQLKLLIFNSQTTSIHIYIDESLSIIHNRGQLKLMHYTYNLICLLITIDNEKFLIIKLNAKICDYFSMKEINIFQYEHQSQRLKIHIKVDQNSPYSGSSTYIGMRDFKLFLILFDDGCMDQNIVPFDGCFSNNFDCIQGCRNCIKGICYGCQIGWEFQEQTKSCIPQCGDALITHDEECDDGNLVGYDGCYKCKYSCPKNCRECQFGKCLKCDIQHVLLEGQCQYISNDIDKTYMEENGEYFYLFIDEGYYWSQDFHIFINKFNLILQQYIKQFENQLDRYNQIFLCHFQFNLISFRVNGCQYNQQINNCKVKQFGKCLECQDQYELDFHKQQCIPKCQDGIVLSQEVCDDGNQIQFDGCYKCQKSCQIECLQCSEDKCFMCQEGWQLQDFQCKQICGDGLLAIISIEQCDDPKDSNCVDCNYQCDHYCLVCDKFQNCEQCLFPFEIKDGKCLPICGDNIITTLFEQCDDGNDIPYDGCFECQYQCSFGCIKCEKDNHCVQCEDNYYILDTYTFRCYELKQNIDSEPKQEQNNNDLLIVQCNQNQAFINNQCVNLCGNGILNTHFELCDDGNNYGGDGCSALCFEEDSFKCINQENSLSICTFIQQPNFNLILLSDKTNQTKILHLSFSQEVYIEFEYQFEQVVEIMIIPQTKFEYIMIPLINITSQLSNPSYQIQIQFFEPVVEPILQINIPKFCIFNQFDFDLSTNSKQIALGTPFVLSAATQQRVSQVIKMNDAMVYSTTSIAGILLLTGNYIVFFNLLDLLQSLSYIRYMQYRFPPHLSQFLETYTKISLKPILDSLKVDEIIAKLNGGTLPYLRKQQSQSKQTDILNQFYLMNAKGCYFSYLASLLTYFICCLISSIKVSQWLGKRFEKNKKSMKILGLISIFQKRIQSKCSKVKNYYFSLGIYQLFYSTLQQLVFSTLLQFPEYTFNSTFEIINSVLALASLLFLIQIFFRLLSITTTQIQDKQKWIYFFQDSKTEFWAGNFKPFQIYKTIFYITIIVEFIRYPEVQSILLSMLSFFYLIYLILFRPIKSNFDLVKLLCREVAFLIMTGSFLVYSLELNEDQFLLYGWLHIALFCFILGFTLIVDILDQVKQAYTSHLKNKEKQQRMQIQLYYDNPLQRFIECNNLNLKKKI